MTDEYEWSEWFLHDGSGMPCAPHEIVHTVDRRGEAHVTRADDPICVDEWDSSWEWGDPADDFYGVDITHYRIRKPRALRQIRDMVENLPAPEREHADT